MAESLSGLLSARFILSTVANKDPEKKEIKVGKCLSARKPHTSPA